MAIWKVSGISGAERFIEADEIELNQGIAVLKSYINQQANSLMRPVAMIPMSPGVTVIKSSNEKQKGEQ